MDWSPPRCTHGHIILGCPHDDCPTQTAYLDQQHAAQREYQDARQRDARDIVRRMFRLATVNPETLICCQLLPTPTPTSTRTNQPETCYPPPHSQYVAPQQGRATVRGRVKLLAEAIPTTPNPAHPLGRAMIHHDPRNRSFAALQTAPTRTTTPGRSWWCFDTYDQQGNSCTAQAAIRCLRTTPHRKEFAPHWPSYDTEQERHALYELAKTFDPWEGVNYEGSSTDAPWKALHQTGAIPGWQWLFGETQVREWLTWHGPCVVGTNWYNNMFHPDTTGHLNLGGPLAGGHAYQLTQYSIPRDAYRITNSWGLDWGQRGRAWLRSTDLRTLLTEQGEAVTRG